MAVFVPVDADPGVEGGHADRLHLLVRDRDLALRLRGRRGGPDLLADQLPRQARTTGRTARRSTGTRRSRSSGRSSRRSSSPRSRSSARSCSRRTATPARTRSGSRRWASSSPGSSRTRTARATRACACPSTAASILSITSRDVLHSFWVPQFAQKQDAVPGADQQLVITPNRLGTFPVICTELCGLGHSLMRSQAVVMSGTATTTGTRARASRRRPAVAAAAARSRRGHVHGERLRGLPHLQADPGREGQDRARPRQPQRRRRSGRRAARGLHPRVDRRPEQVHRARVPAGRDAAASDDDPRRRARRPRAVSRSRTPTEPEAAHDRHSPTTTIRTSTTHDPRHAAAGDRLAPLDRRRAGCGSSGDAARRLRSGSASSA